METMLFCNGLLAIAILVCSGVFWRLNRDALPAFLVHCATVVALFNAAMTALGTV